MPWEVNRERWAKIARFKTIASKKSPKYSGVLKTFYFPLSYVSQIWQKSSCGWSPVHPPPKTGKKNLVT
jgi:hypothetical protein